MQFRIFVFIVAMALTSERVLTDEDQVVVADKMEQLVQAGSEASQLALEWQR